MAVEVLYRTTRDPDRIFMSRSQADIHDAMLELAEGIQAVMRKAVPGISEDHAEELSIYMSKNREIFAKAFGKKPDALLSLIKGTASSDSAEPDA